jgi:hypothetical protein
MLHILAAKKLPLTVTGGSDVDAVHILLLGGHVRAVMEKAVRAPESSSLCVDAFTDVRPPFKQQQRI